MGEVAALVHGQSDDARPGQVRRSFIHVDDVPPPPYTVRGFQDPYLNGKGRDWT